MSKRLYKIFTAVTTNIGRAKEKFNELKYLGNDNCCTLILATAGKYRDKP
jgi:hypothetical protein